MLNCDAGFAIAACVPPVTLATHDAVGDQCVIVRGLSRFVSFESQLRSGAQGLRSVVQARSAQIEQRTLAQPPQLGLGL